MGDNEHSDIDSDDLVPSLQVSGVIGTWGGGVIRALWGYWQRAQWEIVNTLIWTVTI